MCQMGLEIDKPSNVSKIVDKFSKIAYCLKMKTDGHHLIRTDEPVDVLEIPKSINSCMDAVTWAQQKTTPDFSKRLGTISANDRFVVVNLNHVAADGGYIKNLLTTVFEDDPSMTENLSPLPLPLEHFFQKQIDEAVVGDVKDFDTDPLITRIMLKKKDKKHWVPHAPSQAETLIIKANELQCYDKNKKTLKGLTESLWTSICLAAMSFNGKISHFGCTTCDNMRDLIPNNRRLDICNNYSSITTYATPNDKSTLQSIGRAMREDYLRRRANGYLFKTFKALFQDKTDKRLPGNPVELTNVGPLFIKKPVVDAFLGIVLDSEYCQNLISVMASSAVSEDKNDIVIRSRYSPNVMSEKDAKKFTDRIVYLMKNVPLNTNIEEAFRYVQKV